MRRAFVLIALGALAFPVVAAGASTSTPNISPEYTWTVGLERVLAPAPTIKARPVEAPTVATFDGGAGKVGTGGAVEVQGQGPRDDVDARLLNCGGMSYEDFHDAVIQNCECDEPVPTGPLNGGVEVCMTCGWEIEREGTE